MCAAKRIPTMRLCPRATGTARRFLGHTENDTRIVSVAAIAVAVMIIPLLASAAAAAAATVPSNSSHSSVARTDVRQVSVGLDQSCVLFEAPRQLKCWGNGANGQLGTNATENVFTLCDANAASSAEDNHTTRRGAFWSLPPLKFAFAAPDD